ncbi:MAG: tRNA uridine-5-carboxymethylaminomethyl(34) synthesis enzyme MnmG, partial [Pseudomonadales bacterium]|nr:tRNA uridine-5-carboxymethylaminomethyl(34) synthesis enzyme MnmG [Pseudomonadales bacterium]
TLGTNEPYRMFTSRAEYRLTLREDNADLRLTEKGRELGLIDEERWKFFNSKREKIETELQWLRSKWIQPGTDEAARINPLLEKPIARDYSLADLLARPKLRYNDLLRSLEAESVDANNTSHLTVSCEREDLDARIRTQARQQAEIQIKYQGYIDRQHEEIERLKKQEDTQLPATLDYEQMQGLSNELKQKLIAARPENIGRASRIPGMTPAAISLLLIYLKKQHSQENRKAS